MIEVVLVTYIECNWHGLPLPLLLEVRVHGNLEQRVRGGLVPYLLKTR